MMSATFYHKVTYIYPHVVSQWYVVAMTKLSMFSNSQISYLFPSVGICGASDLINFFNS